MNNKDYEIVENANLRLPTLDQGQYRLSNNHMYGLLEVDVTCIRQNLKELRRQHKAVSFTAWIIKTIGDCIDRNKYAQAMLLGKKKLLIFNDVDFALPVERRIGNNYIPYPHFIRAANKKSVYEIDKEIEEEVNKKFYTDDPLFNGSKLKKLGFDLYCAIPQFIRLWIMRIILRSPFKTKKVCGTVGITTVNISGRVSGWIMPTRNAYNLYFGIGSITKKPLVIDDEIKIRDVLNLTVCFNHDTIDGTPARRFMSDLVNLLHKGEVG
jgi:hypothetical protein